MEQIEIIEQMSSPMGKVCSRWCDKCQRNKYHRYYEKTHIEDGVKYTEKYVECYKCKTITHIETNEVRL